MTLPNWVMKLWHWCHGDRVTVRECRGGVLSVRCLLCGYCSPGVTLGVKAETMETTAHESR